MDRQSPRSLRETQDAAGEDDFLVEALRRQLSEHNRQVILISVLILLMTVVLWTAGYAVCRWLTVLFLSATQGADAHPPELFKTLFIYAAGFLFLASWMARSLVRNEMPRDKKSGAEIGLEILMALPRATLAAWRNLSACQSLSESELWQAALLIERLGVEKRVALSRVPFEIPHRRERSRIVLALQVLGIVHLQREETGTTLLLSSKAREQWFGPARDAASGPSLER